MVTEKSMQRVFYVYEKTFDPSRKRNVDRSYAKTQKPRSTAVCAAAAQGGPAPAGRTAQTPADVR